MLVITGTGRSGTGYMSKLLNASGVKCGHESVYQPGGIKEADVQADSSWLAVPHLKSPSVLIVRHPLKVVQSRLDLGVFITHKSWGGSVEKFCPMVYTFDTPQDKALAHWVYWNIYALSKADLCFRLEDMNLGNLNQILKLGGFKTVDEFPEVGIVNHKTKYKKPQPTVKWDDFSPNLSKFALSLAKDLGYEQ